MFLSVVSGSRCCVNRACGAVVRASLSDGGLRALMLTRTLTTSLQQSTTTSSSFSEKALLTYDSTSSSLSSKWMSMRQTFSLVCNNNNNNITSTGLRQLCSSSMVCSGDANTISMDENSFPLDVTSACYERIEEVNTRRNYNPPKHLRVQVLSGGCSGFQYDIKFEDSGELDADEDMTMCVGSSTVVVDKMSGELLQGSKLTFNQNLSGRYFSIEDNPNAEAGCGCGTSFTLKGEGEH
eukprot:m.40326 g.40326  ORF g.40326 m.40326 type:complete len:238 (-) comp10344_c0_seq1:171-884(-)